MHHDTASYPTSSLGTADRLARQVGWFSIGLGLWQLAKPDQWTRSLGMEGSENLVRLCATREVVTGMGALSINPAPAMWARVGGDVLDLAALTWARRDESNPKRDNITMALIAIGALTAVDLYCAQSLGKRHAYQGGPTPDYRDRSGFPGGLAGARGAAARDFETPAHLKAALPSPANSPGDAQGK
ncbi:MAG TPA: hypothetical protein VLO12_07940 [Halomonas sp.]|nr:hypothetical protein [Halomonas sp.]